MKIAEKMVVEIEISEAAVDKLEEFKKLCESVAAQLTDLTERIQKINRQMGFDLEVKQECVVVRENSL